MAIKINAFLAILNLSNVVWDNRFLMKFCNGILKRSWKLMKKFCWHFHSTHLFIWIIYEGNKGQILFTKKTISHYFWVNPFTKDPRKISQSHSSHTQKNINLPSTEPKIEIHG
jgi:hypothetical protein